MFRMFSKNKDISLKEIIRGLQGERVAELETDLKIKSDQEIIIQIKNELLSVDSMVNDRINMQKTGARSTSDDVFVRGLSFYFFSILDIQDERNNFLQDLNHLERIEQLKPTIESVRKHIVEYINCAKKPRPPLQGSVSGRG